MNLNCKFRKAYSVASAVALPDERRVPSLPEPSRHPDRVSRLWPAQKGEVDMQHLFRDPQNQSLGDLGKTTEMNEKNMASKAKKFSPTKIYTYSYIQSNAISSENSSRLRSKIRRSVEYWANVCASVSQVGPRTAEVRALSPSLFGVAVY